MKKEELVKRLTDRFESIKPIPQIGDDDSIHLTEFQQGFKDGVKFAIALARMLEK